MMDELEIAKKAVRRSLLSEDQLREAQAYAAGGRSLLSVLLDLGYLKPQDLGELLAPPARASEPGHRHSPAKAIGLGGLAIFGCFMVLRSCTAGERNRPQSERGWNHGDLALRGVPVPPPAPPVERSIGEQLLRRALTLLSNADFRFRKGNPLTAEQERDVLRAQALLEEAVQQGADTAEAWTALGRAREILDRWDGAAEAYRKGLAKSENDPAIHLGLARILLLLDRPLQAHAEATAACSGPLAGEAFLVRAKADFNLGNKEGARASLELARQKDPSLSEEINALRLKIDE